MTNRIDPSPLTRKQVTDPPTGPLPGGRANPAAAGNAQPPLRPQEAEGQTGMVPRTNEDIGGA